jgi:hypothetical protein
MADMLSAVYGGSASFCREDGSRYIQGGPLCVPCSKSFAQRAIILASLADGVSHLKGYTPCGDNESALAVARALGADVQLDGSTLIIKGVAASLGSLPGLFAGEKATVHVGESGLLARMMIPLMAHLHEGPVEITGEKTLLKRPLTGAREILEAFGCKILRSAQDDREGAQDATKIIKPAAGYSSCPDHTLKGDIIDMLSGKYSLGIKLTESYAMIPEASICGFIFMHPQARYPEIRKISQAEVETYARRRGMDAKTADRFLSHLLK